MIRGKEKENTKKQWKGIKWKWIKERKKENTWNKSRNENDG